MRARHVVIDVARGIRLCQHCGEEQAFSLPQPVSAFLKGARAFEERHARCAGPARVPPRAQAEELPPTRWERACERCGRAILVIPDREHGERRFESLEGCYRIQVYFGEVPEPVPMVATFVLHDPRCPGDALDPGDGSDP